MGTPQWPQEIVVKPMEEIIVPNTCSKPALERRVRPQKDQQGLNCPRCNSTNTKFCYYNNYSLSQPRYFCKSCRRYWTEGGCLRNIPFGGGSRKNKRSSSSSSVSSKKHPDHLVQPASQNPKIYEGQDLNLGFPSHDFKTIAELIQVPDFDNGGKNHMRPSSSSTSSSHHLSATGIGSRGLSSFMAMPISDPNSVYSSGFSLQEFKPTLNFSMDGVGSGGGYGTLQGAQEGGGSGSGRLLFPFEELKKVSSSAPVHIEQDREQRDSTGYWNGLGVLGGGSW